LFRIGGRLGLLDGYTRGQVCPWETIETAVGFDREHSHWTAFRDRLLRDFLQSSGIALWAVAGVGWKLLTYDEQLAERSRKRQRRAYKQIKRDIREIAALPVSELSDHQRNAKAMLIEIARNNLRRLRQGSKRASVIEAATTSLPVRGPRPAPREEANARSA